MTLGLSFFVKEKKCLLFYLIKIKMFENKKITSVSNKFIITFMNVISNY